MKITTTVPTPVPITWTLTLTDDEMADLIGSLRKPDGDLSRYSNRVWQSIVANVSSASLDRLHQRNIERCGEHA